MIPIGVFWGHRLSLDTSKFCVFFFLGGGRNRTSKYDMLCWVEVGGGEVVEEGKLIFEKYFAVTCMFDI